MSTVVRPHDAHAAATLVGVDFSSRPTRRKPIVAAIGQRQGELLKLARLERFETDTAFAA